MTQVHEVRGRAMSDVSKLWGGGPPPSGDEWVHHMVELVRRLEKALGPWLEYEDCLALAYNLRWKPIQWEDGFLPNGEDGELTDNEAGMVAACFHRDKRVDNLWTDLVSTDFSHAPVLRKKTWFRAGEVNPDPLMERLLLDPQICLVKEDGTRTRDLAEYLED
jgi:hypothetical protein